MKLFPREKKKFAIKNIGLLAKKNDGNKIAIILICQFVAAKIEKKFFSKIHWEYFPKFLVKLKSKILLGRRLAFGSVKFNFKIRGFKSKSVLEKY